MLAGVNDSHAQAVQLADALDPRIFKVNLIPFNPTDSEFEGSTPKAIEAFRDELERRGLDRDRAADARARHRRRLRTAGGRPSVGTVAFESPPAASGAGPLGIPPRHDRAAPESSGCCAPRTST